MSNILVIDSDPDVTALLEGILSIGPHQVQTADNGRVGLQMLRERTFDVVITDIVMPECDGFEVIMAINTMQTRPRVIAMASSTMYLSREYLESVAHAMKVQWVLYKPIIISELMKSVFVPDGCAVLVGR